MLTNDPPPMTRVRFLQSVRHAPRDAIGLLVAHGGYASDRPDDLFDVEYQRIKISVERRYLERVED